MLNRTFLPEDAPETACPACGDSIKRGQVAVQCPNCKSWYHVEHWTQLGNRCATFGCTGSGAVSATQPPQPPLEFVVQPVPPIDPNILAQISIEQNPAPNSSSIPPSAPSLLAPPVITVSTPTTSSSTIDQPTEHVTIEPWELELNGWLKAPVVGAVLEKSKVKGLVENLMRPEKQGLVVAAAFSLLAALCALACLASVAVVIAYNWSR